MFRNLQTISDSVVIDIGSSSVKAGFAGFSSPQTEFCSSVAFRAQGAAEEASSAPIIGETKLLARSIGEVAERIEAPHPLGPFNEQVFETIVQTAQAEIGAEHLPFFCSESLFERSKDRIRRTEILLETIGAPATLHVPAAALPAFAAGRHTALVVESGASLSVTVPVVDGFVLRNSARVSPLAGDMLSRRVLDQVEAAAASRAPQPEGMPFVRPTFVTSADVYNSLTPAWADWARLRLADQMKQLAAGASGSAVTVELPDGVSVPIPTSACLDAMFDTTGLESEHLPKLYGDRTDVQLSPHCIPAICAESVSGHSDRVTRDLLAGVVLAGGTTCTRGFECRFIADLAARVPAVMRVSLASSRAAAVAGGGGARLLGWRGGSILASAQAFSSLWVSKAEWDESGPAILDSRSF